MLSPSRNFMPSQDMGSLTYPRRKLATLGIGKTRNSEIRQWAAAVNSFQKDFLHIAMGNIFIFVAFLNSQTCLTDPHHILLTCRRKFLPSALPWQFEILFTFCILWTSQTICRQTAAAQKGERNFTIEGEIKLVSCSPAFDFQSKYIWYVSSLVLLKGQFPDTTHMKQSGMWTLASLYVTGLWLSESSFLLSWS